MFGGIFGSGGPGGAPAVEAYGFTVLKGTYTDKIARLYSDGTKPAAELGAALRAALAAIPAGWKVELDGPWTIDRDGANDWCLNLPDKSLHIIGLGRETSIRHYNPASDTDAQPLIVGAFTGTKHLVIENLGLEGIWARQASKQEVTGARLMNLNNGDAAGDRTLLLHGVRGLNGIEMGLTAQNWELIEADRCTVEYNTRDCINLNGMVIRVTHCRMKYSSDDCVGIYIPSASPGPRSAAQYIRSVLVAHCDAYQTNGIKVAAPRLKIIGNTLRDCKHYGIRVFVDEAGEGAASPDDVTIALNDIYDLIQDEQVPDGGGSINAGIEVSSYERMMRNLRVADNTIADTRGALWTGTAYTMPHPEGLYRKTGFVGAWPLQTAGNEPSYQRQRGFRLVSKSPAGEAGWRLYGNLGGNLRTTAGWEQACVIFASAGTNWAVPAAETVWPGFAGVHMNFSNKWCDFRPLKMWIVPTITALGVADTQLKIGWASSQGGSYTAICNVVMSGTGTQYGGGYATIPATAVAAGGVWFKILGQAGNGSAVTTITQVEMWLSADGDWPAAERSLG